MVFAISEAMSLVPTKIVPTRRGSNISCLNVDIACYAHLATLFGINFLNMSSCFAWTAIFASSISGRICNVLSMRCSEPLNTTV